MCLGVLQISVSRSGIKGLWLTKSGFVNRCLGVILIVLGPIYFFVLPIFTFDFSCFGNAVISCFSKTMSTDEIGFVRNINDFDGGLAGAQQAFWFSLAALLSICVSAVSGAFVTRFYSSKLNDETYGLAMLSYSSYLATFNKSVKFLWKSFKTNFSDLL